jgi:hypothetical protein
MNAIQFARARQALGLHAATGAWSSAGPYRAGGLPGHPRRPQSSCPAVVFASAARVQSVRPLDADPAPAGACGAGYPHLTVGAEGYALRVRFETGQGETVPAVDQRDLPAVPGGHRGGRPPVHPVLAESRREFPAHVARPSTCGRLHRPLRLMRRRRPAAGQEHRAFVRHCQGCRRRLRIHTSHRERRPFLAPDRNLDIRLPSPAVRRILELRAAWMPAAGWRRDQGWEDDREHARRRLVPRGGPG